MGKRKPKKRRKRPAGKRARVTEPSSAITEVVSDIVRTLTDKKFGAKLADKNVLANRTKADLPP